jgi:hypothetical protein
MLRYGISQYFGNNGRMVEYRGGIGGSYAGNVIVEVRKFQRGRSREKIFD